MDANDKKAADAEIKRIEGIKKAKKRLYGKILSFLKINTIMILLDLFILKSGFTIPSFVLLGTGIGLVAGIFNYFSDRTKLGLAGDITKDLHEQKRGKKYQESFYDLVYKDIEETRVKIGRLIDKCSSRVKNHKNRIMKDVESIISSIRVLAEKGRGIDLVLKETDLNIIEGRKREFQQRLSSTENDKLKNDLLDHIKVLEHQIEKYKKLIEAEEMIKLKIESTKASLSTMILDLSRIDLTPDLIVESELDTAINNIELRTVELNTLAEILDKEEI